MKSLVVRLDSAGDVLLAGPAIRAVAHRSREVVLLCGPQGAPAGRLLPGVDRVRVWAAPWVGFDPAPVRAAEIGDLVAELAAERFDRALVLTSFHQSPLPAALLLRLAAVPWIAADCEDYPGSLLDLRHRRADGRHEAQAAVDLARAAGYPLPAGDEGRLAVLAPPDQRSLTGPGPYVVVHPGSSVPARAVGAALAADIVAALTAAGHRVVVTGGPDEKAITAQVAGPYGLDLGGRTDLPALAGVLSGAAAVVVGNTGPAHLAAAVGTPVVSLFAPVVPPDRWRPFGVPHVLLGRQDAACAGTRARTCPVPGHPCLDTLTGREVAAAVEVLLDRRSGPAPAAPTDLTPLGKVTQ